MLMQFKEEVSIIHDSMPLKALHMLDHIYKIKVNKYVRKSKMNM